MQYCVTDGAKDCNSAIYTIFKNPTFKLNLNLERREFIFLAVKLN